MLQIAFRNLLGSKLRTLFTLLGIAVSLSVYMTLASVTIGYRDQLNQTVGITGIDGLVQSKNSPSVVNSHLSESEIDLLRQNPAVGEVTPLLLGSLRSRVASYFVLVGLSDMGLLESLTHTANLGVIQGRMFLAGKNEAMVGEKAAKKFKLETGSDFKAANGSSLKIVGVYRMGMDVLDGAIITDAASARQLLGRQEGEYSIALIKAKPDIAPLAMIASVNNSAPTLWASAAKGLKSHIRALTLIDAFLKVVTIASFLLSGMVLANTLLMAISERTHEIGILMVIGWSKTRIISMILIEGMILCISGSVIGYGFTWLILPALEAIPSLGAGWLPAGPPISLLPQAMLIAAVTGFLSGLFPAFYSTRLNPVEALRSE